jgi:hypothetical protein
MELEGPALCVGVLKTVYRGKLRLHVQGEAPRTVPVTVMRMRRGDWTHLCTHPCTLDTLLQVICFRHNSSSLILI